VRITHYYGLSDVIYDGMFDFSFNYATRLPYLKIWLVLLINKLSQYFFNKKKFITKQRMDLLRLVVTQYLDGKRKFNSFDLMDSLYSMKWILHPDGDLQRRKVDFYIKSLIDTGDIEQDRMEYVVTGRSLKTIENYEEQDRRHVANVRMQWIIIALTCAMAFSGLVQAKILEFK
jgi:hypothetical protein